MVLQRIVVVLAIVLLGTVKVMSQIPYYAGTVGDWKIQSELTPRANVSLTPENFLILTP